MAGRFAGKSAIVTGGGQGIGRAISLSFAREGADVVVTDINLDVAKAVASEIMSMGRRALAIEADVSEYNKVNLMTEAALREMGKVDILVNNAGGGAREKVTEFSDSREETWNVVFGRNLKGTFNCTRAVIKHMINQGYGKVVNIGSGAGVSGSPMQTDYSAAKAGIIGFTKALAKEVGVHGINVNCVSPGIVKTQAIELIPKKLVDENISRQAIKRLGEPQDVANAVLFMASDEASFITGQNLVVCGGGRIS
ncbi:SDR family NAD(P)-dependent oxidoreductase [Chloroflexota bacterium]